MAASRSTSVPEPDPQVFVGRIGRAGADGVDHDHPSAARPFRARTRQACRGTVIIDPLETSGLAPMTTNRSARSMSGTGTDSSVPYIRTSATVAASGPRCSPRTGTGCPAPVPALADRTCWSRCAFGLPR